MHLSSFDLGLMDGLTQTCSRFGHNESFWRLFLTQITSFCWFDVSETLILSLNRLFDCVTTMGLRLTWKLVWTFYPFISFFCCHCLGILARCRYWDLKKLVVSAGTGTYSTQGTLHNFIFGPAWSFWWYITILFFVASHIDAQ